MDELQVLLQESYAAINGLQKTHGSFPKRKQELLQSINHTKGNIKNLCTSLFKAIQTFETQAEKCVDVVGVAKTDTLDQHFKELEQVLEYLTHMCVQGEGVLKTAEDRSPKSQDVVHMYNSQLSKVLADCKELLLIDYAKFFSLEADIDISKLWKSALVNIHVGSKDTGEDKAAEIFALPSRVSNVAMIGQDLSVSQEVVKNSSATERVLTSVPEQDSSCISVTMKSSHEKNEGEKAMTVDSSPHFKQITEEKTASEGDNSTISTDIITEKETMVASQSASTEKCTVLNSNCSASNQEVPSTECSTHKNTEISANVKLEHTRDEAVSQSEIDRVLAGMTVQKLHMIKYPSTQTEQLLLGRTKTSPGEQRGGSHEGNLPKNKIIPIGSGKISTSKGYDENTSPNGLVQDRKILQSKDENEKIKESALMQDIKKEIKTEKEYAENNPLTPLMTSISSIEQKSNLMDEQKIEAKKNMSLGKPPPFAVAPLLPLIQNAPQKLGLKNSKFVYSNFDIRDKILHPWNAKPAVSAQLVKTITGGPKASFDHPIGCCVLTNGQLVVADTGNNCVKIMSSNNLIRTIGLKDGIKFIRPSAVASDDQNNIYVKDDFCLQIFNITGELLKSVGSNVFRYPYGLSLRNVPNRGLAAYVLDVGPDCSKLHRYLVAEDTLQTCYYEPLKFYGTHRSKVRFFAVHNEVMLASDLGASWVYLSQTNGKNLNCFGKFGSGDGDFTEPSGIAVDKNGNWLVADSKNNRVQVFYNDGNFVASINLSHGIRRPSGIHLTSDGHLYIINYLDSSIKVYSFL